jgi:hypothetical protein
MLLTQVEAYGPDPDKIRSFPEAGIFDLGNFLLFEITEINIYRKNFFFYGQKK